MTALHERLAAYSHNAWSGWQAHLFSKSQQNEDGSVTIPVELVARWKRQMGALYSMLPENEKESNRKEAEQILKIVARALLAQDGDL